MQFLYIKLIFLLLMDSLCVFKLSQNKYYVDKINKSVIPDIIEILNSIDLLKERIQEAIELIN